MATLYDRIGGGQAILMAVNVFYDKVSNHPVVGHYFYNLDLDKLARKQAAFLSIAFEGPLDDEVRGLREAHTGLGISHAEFDIVAGCLKETLVEIGVEESLCKEVLGIVESTRKDVVEEADSGHSVDPYES